MSYMESKAERFLESWVKDSYKDSCPFHIHISHWDLDGYGCFIALDSAIMVYHEYVELPDWGIQAIAQTPDKVDGVLGAALEKFAKEYASLDPKNYPIRVLVTDLAPDPAVFQHYIDKGYRIEWCVIDHHQNHHHHDGKTDLIGNNVYLIDPSASATYHVGNILLNSQRRSTRGLDYEYMDRLREFIHRVSRYDTGNWGEWNDDFDSIEDSVLEQLAFGYAVREAKAGDEEIMAEYQSKRMHALVDGVDIRGIWTSRLMDEWKMLKEEYQQFLDRLIDMSTKIEIPCFQIPMLQSNGAIFSRNIRMPALKVKGIITRKDEPAFKHFSLISREVLEEYDPSIDILVYVNLARGSVELRSAKYNIDVSQIAFANGGGGHPRAAGFPLEGVIPWGSC